MKKREKLLFLILWILIIINPVYASFSLANSTLTNSTNLTYNKPYELELSYSPSEALKGWINIKFTNESSDSLLTGFDNKIKLKEFLDANSAPYTCFPPDCTEAYALIGTEEKSKTFSLAQKQSKILGIRLTGEDVTISGLSFNVSSDAGDSCMYPLKIDVLNDGIYEWKAEEISDEVCFIDNQYGCFDKEYSSEDIPILSETSYCEKIKVPPLKAFRIGANVKGNGTGKFAISLGAGEIVECDASINQSGEVSCIVEFEDALEKYTEVEVCITSSGGSIYSIAHENYANALRCGRVGGETEFDEDFEIFAKPIKYKGIKKYFAFDQNLVEDAGNDFNLAIKLSDYVLEKYEKRCNPECIIPIKIEAGTEQQIKIYDITLTYKDGGKPYTKDKLYELGEGSLLINSGFLRLDLEKANIIVPSEYGAKNLILKLGDTKILEQEINVKKIPKIIGIYPKNPSALVPVNFFVFLDGPKGNVTYTWDFGDGSPEESSESESMKHSYSEIKDYEIKVKVKNDYGESSKTFSISTVAPSEGINQTIKQYRKDLENIKTEINALPEFIEKEVGKKIDVDYLKSQIDKSETKYKETLSSETEELIKIMKDLLNLKVPYKLEKGFVIKPMMFIQSENQINLQTLEELGAGSPEKTTEEYYNAMNSWSSSELKSTFSSDTYVFYYRSGGSEALFSDVKLDLEPETGINEFYVVINGDPAKIQFNGDYKAKDFGNSVGITFTDISEKTILEFLHPDKIDPLELPVYISPEFQNLDFTPTIGVCNNNGVCEKSRNENSKNCRADCKPWKLAFFILIIILIITFVIYSILQQWYKKNYENHLFKNKNQLYNLINFMSISANQGMKKEEIFHKLLKLKWNKEQLSYAWNKVKGRKTGMWEIPFSDWLKKIKIKKEDNKTVPGNAGFQQGSAPSKNPNEAFKK